MFYPLTVLLVYINVHYALEIYSLREVGGKEKVILFSSMLGLFTPGRSFFLYFLPLHVEFIMIL